MKNLKIFHIPGWHPTRESGFGGIFIKEFIDYYAFRFPKDQLHQIHYLDQVMPVILKRPFNFFKFPFHLASSDRSVSIQKNLETWTAGNGVSYSSRLGFRMYNFLYAELNRVFRILSKESRLPDLIHAHVTYPSGVVAKRLSEEYNIPYIITEHSSDFSLIHPEENEVIESLRKASEVIYVNEEYAMRLSELCNRPVRCIPNMVDERLFHPADVPVADGIFTVTCITSSFQERKGIKYFLEAVKKIKEQEGYSFILAGPEDECRADLEDFANSLGLEKIIQWMPKLSRTEIARVLQGSDCFVLPSLSESFGMIVAEAHACGIPVVATRCVGPEPQINGQNGILVQVKNPDAIAEAVLKLYSKRNETDPQKIRQSFLENFSGAVITQGYRDLYKDVIQSHRR